jgi:hypothetical protein
LNERIQKESTKNITDSRGSSFVCFEGKQNVCLLPKPGLETTRIVFALTGISLSAEILAVNLPLLKGKRRKSVRKPPAKSNQITNLKIYCMPNKAAHPKKNKPTKKKSSAQKKGHPKTKAR